MYLYVIVLFLGFFSVIFPCVVQTCVILSLGYFFGLFLTVLFSRMLFKRDTEINI